jgi:hypothetical protein
MKNEEEERTKNKERLSKFTFLIFYYNRSNQALKGKYIQETAAKILQYKQKNLNLLLFTL